MRPVPVSPLRGLLAAALFALASCAEESSTSVLQADSERPPVAPGAADYVGGSTCAGCHADEAELWRGSHHDLAMQEASEDTVLGDFEDASYTHFGVTSTFTRRGDEFVVRTDGPDGELADYEVLYTFGVEPLQQYLVEFPGGRLQALALAWDTRAREQGGQRWYHLYPDEPIPSVDELHWTRRRQNWNFSCAECHSTKLRKGYDESSDSYDTTWSEIDVSCEACHGPGSLHVAWAEASAAGTLEQADPGMGLVSHIEDKSGGAWVMNVETGIAERSAPRVPDTQTDTCGRCHARRLQLREDYLPDEPLLDTHLPRLLEPGLYHPDGQILDEVYVWGSFVQSKMHAAGVRCTDCHDPHSGRVPTTGNDLCSVCHLTDRFDTAEHHGHPQGGPGSRCVDCHMPERSYMVVDPRRDHGFHVPRPDLSMSLGVPNACAGCHAERGAEWAAEAIAGWGPRGEREEFATLFSAAGLGLPGTVSALAALIGDGSRPGFVRATAVEYLAAFPDPSAFDVLALALEDESDLVRLAAARALQSAPPQQRVGALLPRLTDERLAVRIEAARSLSDLAFGALPEADRKRLGAARAELEASEHTNADTPEAHLNLALLHERAGRTPEAEAEYRAALERDPLFAPAAINLADLLRRLERDDEAETVLRTALALANTSPALNHSLGLWLVRAGRTEEALQHLRRAAEAGPGEARLGYVYGVALASTGSSEQALGVYRSVLQRHPFDQDTRMALASLHVQMGDLDAARVEAQRLARDWPRDPGVQQLVAQISALAR